MAYRVLVADDEREIRSVMTLYLEDAGYEVVEASSGPEALEALRTQRVDLCLLDIMMPGIDGLKVLRRVRETSDVPIVVVSAKDQDRDKILGLNLGADDYLAKPFNPLEAVARVNSNIRRAKGALGKGVQASAPLRCGSLVLDRNSCTLTCAGVPIRLTWVEYRIMLLLMEHPGHVFTKRQIYEFVWDDEYASYENNVMVSMSKLRSKLGEARRCIKTIRGLGYRLEEL